MDSKQLPQNFQGFSSESAYLLNDNELTLKRSRKEASKKRKFCVLVACVIQLVVCGGTGYGLSVMYAEIIIVFNTERADAALIQSFNMGMAAASGIMFTWMIKKFGPGVCITIGASVSAIGLFASAFADNLVTITVCTGVITGTAMGICQLCAYLTVTWTFHHNPGLFLVILTFGMSFGQLIGPNMYELFISNYAWSGAFILLAAVSLQLIPFGLVIHLSRYYFVRTSDMSIQEKQRSCCDISLFIDVVIWVLWINFLLLALTGNVEPWFIVDHMISLGFSRKDGAFTSSAIGIGNFIGKLIGAFIKFRCRQVATVYHWIYLGVLMAGLHMIIISLDQLIALFLFCLLFGCIFGLIFSQAPVVMFEASGLDRYPQACAMMNVMFGIGDVFGPLLGGYIKDITGVYNIAFFIASGASVYISVSSVCGVYYSRKRHM
ncbi:monocarboxylate transporter 13-like [Mercenaria mercenaria]|uniref:monocarboxylate transporter 13-like n=1 Tax=Mercenaria mercenaria TaxID=6596 RepID=UPI00234F8B37|nr:monocarboxylate transporter 13-like [Mercenaria mercenaria]